jgi:hypothetical protein|tara:strand:- start:71 stop:505 length:435 start_codon:yes stop_codon:yes gene_type:complete
MTKKQIVAETHNDDWIPKKVRKKRKPMTPEQKIAAAERLEKARAAKSPAKNQTIHSEVLAKPDDHPLCVKNVKSWIRSSKEQLSALRGDMRRDVKGAKARFYGKEGYIRNMQHYLKHGDWIDDFYGEYEEKKVQWRTIKDSGIM